jgi:hypothetical protein
MKKSFLFFIGMTMFMSARAQEEPRVDTVAVMIIDRMASVIGELTSCSFTLTSSVDIEDPGLGLVKHSQKDEIYFSGPDRLLVHSYGDKGHRGFWYDGEKITCYWFDENNFSIIEAPDNTIAMIDQVNNDYGIEFPAADFFYPTFTDDILDHFDNIVFLGKKKFNDHESFHILASNQDMSVQFWFANDAYNLPERFVIIYKNDGNRQFEATFSNWQLNPDIPVTVFEFMPPPKAREIAIMPRTKK